MKIAPTHTGNKGHPSAQRTFCSAVSKGVPAVLSKEPGDSGSEGTSQQVPLASEVIGI